jgi:serine kinase of HPr protein (carbohydrate metabolism regulator)
MAAEPSTIHASAVLVGATAVLIRGPSGSGKSRLAWDLIQAAGQGVLPFARLVGDDRVFIEVHHNQLLVRPAPQLAGLIEVHGLGIRRLAYEPLAVVGLAVDLAAPDGARMPDTCAQKLELLGVSVPRLTAATGMAALPLVLAFLRTRPGGN